MFTDMITTASANARGRAISKEPGLPGHRSVRVGSRGSSGSELPDAELDVLACLWQKGPLTSNQLCTIIADYRPMTHGSMMTLLKRLQSKGWVDRKKGPVGKAFVYRAAREPGPTHRALLGNLVHRIFGGNGLAVVSALFDAKPPTPHELDRLQQLLDELRGQYQTGEDTGERPD